MTYWNIIKAAIAADPRLKLAGGVALLGAVISAVLSFTGGDRELAILGGVFVVGFMVLLTIFISVTNSKRPQPYVAGFLIWSISIAFVASIVLMLTSYFFCWPQLLGRSCAQRQYARGEIANLPPLSKKRIGIAFDEDAMGSFNRVTRAFHFVVMANDRGRDSLIVTVRNPDEGVEADEDIRVHVSCFAPYFHSAKLMEWRYAEDDRTQPDGSVVKTPVIYRSADKIGEYGAIEPLACRSPPAVPATKTSWRRFLPTMAAQAQTPPAVPQ